MLWVFPQLADSEATGGFTKLGERGVPEPPGPGRSPGGPAPRPLGPPRRGSAGGFAAQRGRCAKAASTYFLFKRAVLKKPQVSPVG